ncbi:MAG: aldolase/citrate lyase family protein [Acidobacteriota bacterium]|nr:aldolase/citrate lyase family protein [Acidobacteriota bacterium]
MKIPVSRPVAGRLLLLGLACGLAACSSPPADDAMPAAEEAAEPDAAGNAGPSWNRVASLLADGQVVFGIFSGERTPETAMEMAQQELADFIFYSLERGPFDLPTMSAYQKALSPPDGRGSANPHPVLLRIPPIRDGMDEAAERTAAGLDAGVYGIVFPHVETADEARHAVASMTLAGAGGLRPDADPEAARVFGVSPEDYAARAGVWPLDPAGELVSFLLIEDQIGIENALAITSVPGISIVSPGPGDLRRAYEGDMEAVEGAIQTVLAACLEAGVPCGITAGPDDIAMRIEQGFRVFIVTSPEALAVGHQAAGR